MESDWSHGWSRGGHPYSIRDIPYTTAPSISELVEPHCKKRPLIPNGDKAIVWGSCGPCLYDILWEIAELSITNASMQYQDISGPPDSHEAMNNREFNQSNREKRSFEFLVGLINNNSKYEVIRSDPELSVSKGILRKTEGSSPEATKLLLDLLAKIVTYPEHWNQIHKILTNLDQDISSSQHILHQQRPQQQFNINSPYLNSELKRKSEERKLHETRRRQQPSVDSTTMKWPTFDDIDDDYPTSSKKPEAHSYSEKSTYQKNFAYHKVTGKPAHLKKNPTAYISVSAVAPKPSETEDDYMLETELHQLKPWKNKQHSNNEV